MNNYCKFCEVDSKFIIATSEYSYAVSFPVAIKEGHYVVLPKRHIPTFTDLKTHELEDFFRLAGDLSKKIKDQIGCEKFYINAINDEGEHFHMHFMPKNLSDPKMIPHVFSKTGWEGQLQKKFSEQEVLKFIENFKTFNNEELVTK